MNGQKKPGEVVKRSPWKNRIIGSDIVDPKTLQPNELNWRKHPKPQADALNGALDSIGWIQDIIVNKQTGRMIDGHLRVELALKNNETEVPVKYVDLTPEEEEQALLTLDPIGAMAEADKNLLEALLNQVQTDDERIKNLMDSIGQDYKIKKEVKEDDYEPPAEIETDIQRGDIYQLGRHRVMCGDSTSEEDVGKLMDGKKTDLMVTDPPYNMAGESGMYAKSAPTHYRSTAVLAGSDWDIGFDPDLFLKTSLKFLSIDRWIYIFTSHFLFGQIIEFIKNNFENSGFCAWCKPNPAPSLSKTTWTYAVELCCFGKSGKGIFNYPGGQHCLNYWLVNKKTDGTHPTQKPVELFSNIVGRCSNTNDIILDPFLGSGTTLIACEQLDRICYGMEISPQYCEIICQRWEKLTGKQREKVRGVST